MLGVGCGGPAKLFQKAPLRSFIVLQLSNPSQKSIWDDLDCVRFPCQKWGQTGSKTGTSPDPWTLPKMSEILFRTPLIFSGTGEELLEIDLLAGISTQVHPAHLGASRQKTECAGVLTYM